jgi:hypothetical protein
MPRGKHLTKKERQALLSEIKYFDGEPFTTVKGMKILCNALIDNDETTLERCLPIMQTCNAQVKKPTTLVPCTFCARKIGLKQCSGCSRTDNIRYCSRECQLAAWPEHKAVCSGCMPEV